MYQIKARTTIKLQRFFYRGFSGCQVFAKQKSSSSFQISPEHKFKCGLEIHCQLKTSKKLFSNSEHVFNEFQNSRVSYFDAGLPGTQPILNPEAVLLTLIAGLALNAKANKLSTFDRKHYFYGDQPLGYQITQRYNPIFKGGHLKLTKQFDDIDQPEKIITFDQIQIEQDTGKSIHVDEGISTLLDYSAYSKIDLNRANVPLIEVVTNPDFEDFKQIKAFVRKFQSLVKFLGISSGDLETGAMRVDVNVSVNGGNRVEIKNLSSTTAILGAIRYEYTRQVEMNGKFIEQETRGWDGVQTTRIRKKETSVDYRYMPDPELPPILLSESLLDKVKHNHVKQLPDDVIKTLIASPYELRVKDAKLLISDTYPGLLAYYLSVFDQTVKKYGKDKIPTKVPGNFILHELVGQLGKVGLSFNKTTFPEKKLVEIIASIYIDKKLTKSSGKLLFAYIIENHNDTRIQSASIDELIEEFELESPSELDQNILGEIEQLCDDVILRYPEISTNLRNGKKLNSLQYLVGQAMRTTQGKIQAKVFEEQFKKMLGIK